MKSKVREIKPVEDVESDGGACVANVAEIVGSDAAHVHAHAPRHERIEDLLLLCHRVVNPKSLFLRHSSISLSLLVSVCVCSVIQSNPYPNIQLEKILLYFLQCTVTSVGIDCVLRCQQRLN